MDVVPCLKPERETDTDGHFVKNTKAYSYKRYIVCIFRIHMTHTRQRRVAL
jgi:hypothetical protein